MGGFGSAVLGSRFIDVAWGEAGSMPRQNANKSPTNRSDLGRTPEQSGSR
jgi:hypothetical protein